MMYRTCSGCDKGIFLGDLTTKQVEWKKWTVSNKYEQALCIHQNNLPALEHTCHEEYMARNPWWSTNRISYLDWLIQKASLPNIA